MDLFRRLFSFTKYDEKDKVYFAARLRTAALLYFYAALLFIAYFLAVRETYPVGAFTYSILLSGVSAAVSLILLFLINKGLLRLSGIVIVLQLFYGVTWSIYSFEGLHDSTIIGYAFVIATTAYMMGRNEAVWTTILSILALVGIYLAEVNRWVSFSYSSDPLFRVFVPIFTLILIMIMLNGIIQRLDDSLKQALMQNAQREMIEESFSSIFYSSPDGKILVNESGLITMVNSNIEKIFGYLPDEIKGSHFEIFMPQRYRENHVSKAKDFMQNPYGWLMGDGREFLALHKNGREINVEISLTPLKIKGEKFIAVGFVDISVRKLAESRTQLILSLAVEINTAENFNAALFSAHALICDHTGWSVGEAWIPNASGDALEYSAANYCTKIDPDLIAFNQLSKELTFPKGIGLPGRVWASREPEWDPDVSMLPEDVFLRAKAAKRLGIKAALGVPIIAREKVLAVLVYFMEETQEENSAMIKLISSVGLQLGIFLERKQAEDAIHLSQRRLSKAEKKANLGHWERNIESDTIYASDEMYRILGLSPKETPASLDVFFEMIHPDDLEMVKETTNTILERGENINLDYRIIRPDGEIRYVHAEGEPSKNEKGEYVGVFGTFQDVTERKHFEAAILQSEKRLSEAERIANLGHWERIIETGENFWSDELYNIYGLKKGEFKASFNSFISRVYIEDRAAVKSLDHQAIHEGKKFDLDFRIVRPSGEIRYVNEQAEVTRDQDGNPVRVFGTTQDITERKQQEQELKTIADISEVLRQAATSGEVIPAVLKQVLVLLRAEASALSLYDSARGEYVIVAGDGLWADAAGAQFLLRDEHAGGSANLTNRMYILNDTAQESPPVYIDKSQPDFIKRVKSIVGVPVQSQTEFLGTIWVGKHTPINYSDLQHLNLVSNITGNTLNRAYLNEDMENNFIETVLALAKTLGARDSQTADHSERIALMAELTLQAMGGTPEEINLIRLAALLHDIGKIGIPDEILLKPGPLTDEERQIMRNHPEIGAGIIAPIRKLSKVAPLVRAHQELFDGSGYPNGLKGEEIPLAARVLTVVDAFMAMTEDRPYRKAGSVEDAMIELRACAGSNFDPAVVKTFEEVLRSIGGIE